MGVNEISSVFSYQANEIISPYKQRADLERKKEKTSEESSLLKSDHKVKFLSDEGNEKPQTLEEKNSGNLKGQAEKAAKSANDRARLLGTDAKFEYNKEIDRIVITISASGSNEVIKEIPQKEIQKMLERIHTMTGMIMDEEA